MEKALFSALAAMLLAGMARAQDAKMVFSTVPPITISTAADVAEFKWEKTTHNFGSITQGIPVTLVYSFSNSGTAPLVISNVVPSCGCTGADWTKEPIMPGKEGFVKITFNAGNMGAFNKTLTVQSNASSGVVTLNFNGEVVAAKETAIKATKSN